jgi:hypothetical protein
MDRVRFIEHKGKRILFVDFSNATPDQVLEAIDIARVTIKEEDKSSVLVLTDATNGRFDRRVTQALRDYASQNEPFVKASAIVGVSGMQKVILGALVMLTGRRFMLFDEMEKAKDWLVVWEE